MIKIFPGITVFTLIISPYNIDNCLENEFIAVFEIEYSIGAFKISREVIDEINISFINNDNIDSLFNIEINKKDVIKYDFR